jgi:hypothetical protein
MVKRHNPLGLIERQALNLAALEIYPFAGEVVVFVKNKQVREEINLRLADKSIQLAPPFEEKPIHAILWLETIEPNNVADFNNLFDNLISGGRLVVLTSGDFSKWQASPDNEFGNSSMVVGGSYALRTSTNQTELFIEKTKGIFGFSSFFIGICAGFFQRMGINHLADRYYFNMREKMEVNGLSAKFSRYNLIIVKKKNKNF